jgi:hypothetical protein
LKFNANRKFKIVQFTDIHFGEGFAKDQNNQRLISEILEQEQPDMAVVTGDVVSGYAWNYWTRPWAALQYANFTRVLMEHGTYWATTAGNHDTQADLNREQVSELDRSFNLSLTLPNAEANLSHAFNYVLPVYDSKGTEVAFRMWFLDSGDDNCLGEWGYDCVRPDQIDWFRREQNAIPNSEKAKGRGFLFVHIPLFEYVNLYNDYSYFGSRGEDICCWSVNTGLFAALKEQPTVEWVSAGHDHNNDYYGSYQGINLAYGRKTGFGSYANITQGARVFEITQDPYSIETWVREDGGNVVIETQSRPRDPFTSKPQTRCGGTLGKAQLIDPEDEELHFLREYYLRRADLKHLIKE